MQEQSSDSTKLREIILCINGPGELYAWALPMLLALKQASRDLRVVASLLPCPFASGQEGRIAREMGFDGLTSVAEYLAFAAGGPRPRAYSKGVRGLVLQLGGDAMHAVRIGQRLGRPVWRYSFEPYWHNGLEQLFVHDERTRKRVRSSSARVTVVGNLVADALAQSPNPIETAGPLVLCFAGSRRFEAMHMLGLFGGAIEHIEAQVPGCEFVWVRSRMLDDALIRQAILSKSTLESGGMPMQLIGTSETGTLVTPQGVRMRIAPEEERYALMRQAELALTIPGTNTLELGIAGVPSVVCLPLQRPEFIPIEGLGQYISLIPVLGPWLKGYLVRKVVSRFKYVALPNMITDSLIQPELRGDVSAERIAQTAVDLLNHPDKQQLIRNKLAELMPKPGAAARLSAAVLERLEEQKPSRQGETPISS